MLRIRQVGLTKYCLSQEARCLKLTPNNMLSLHPLMAGSDSTQHMTCSVSTHLWCSKFYPPHQWWAHSPPTYVLLSLKSTYNLPSLHPPMTCLVSNPHMICSTSILLWPAQSPIHLWPAVSKPHMTCSTSTLVWCPQFPTLLRPGHSPTYELLSLHPPMT